MKVKTTLFKAIEAASILAVNQYRVETVDYREGRAGLLLADGDHTLMWLPDQPVEVDLFGEATVKDGAGVAHMMAFHNRVPLTLDMIEQPPEPFVVLIPDVESGKPSYPLMAPPGMPGHEAVERVEAAIKQLTDDDRSDYPFGVVCKALEPLGFVAPNWLSSEEGI